MSASKKQRILLQIAAFAKKHRRWFFLLIGIGFILLGMLFINAGHFAEGSLSFLKPSATEAAQNPKLTKRDARTFYDAGLLSHSAASDLFPQQKDSEPFKNLLKEAERNYLLAIEIWSRLYNEIPPDSADEKTQCERAWLLESINYALWRLMPINKGTAAELNNIKSGIVKNFLEAFAALEHCRPETKAITVLKRRMQQDLEKVREEDKKQNERQQNPQSPGSQSDQERSAMHFPGDQEASEVKKREDQIKQAKDRAESALQKEREKAEKGEGAPAPGEGEGEESTGQTRQKLESIPGIGQMPLPSIRK